MGRRSLEVYLAAEISQEFANLGYAEVVYWLVDWGVGVRWSWLLLSIIWAGVFAWFGFVLDRFGWRLRL
jgi:hypothetical protein